MDTNSVKGTREEFSVISYRGKSVMVLLFGLMFLNLCGCTTTEYPAETNFYETKYAFEYIEWSPDSQMLVGSTYALPLSGIFASQNASEVYIWHPHQDSYRRVSDETYSKWNTNPHWSPQGNEVLYYSFDEFGANTLGIVDVESLQRNSISNGSSADWLPDGESIVTNNIKDIRVVSISSQVETVVWSADRFLQIIDLAVAPDGNYIAAAIDDVQSNFNYIYLIEPYNRHETVILEGQDFPKNIDWSPDGRWLIFVANGEVLALNINSKCVTEAINLGYKTDDVDWSPDNRVIAFAINDESISGVLLVPVDSEIVHVWLASGGCLDQ